MILPDLLDNILKHLYGNISGLPIIDIGGGKYTYNRATVVLDLVGSENDPRYRKQDVLETPWDFSDDEFYFSYCSHVLEDVRDPRLVAREMRRVSRAGAIFMPHRLEELSKGVSGIPDIQGWSHHMWLFEVDVNRNTLEATPKTSIAVKYSVEETHPIGTMMFWTKETCPEIVTYSPTHLMYDGDWKKKYEAISSSKLQGITKTVDTRVNEILCTDPTMKSVVERL